MASAGCTRRRSCDDSPHSGRSHLQATLIQRPDVALIALTHRLLLRAFPLYGCSRESAVQVDGRAAELRSYASELTGSPAEVALRARSAAIEAQLPKDPEQLFAWLSEQPQTEVLVAPGVLCRANRRRRAGR